jgi:hypothetical protein
MLGELSAHGEPAGRPHRSLRASRENRCVGEEVALSESGHFTLRPDSIPGMKTNASHRVG